ncbi:uncharacterized protein LOC143531185 [Bidens hawaiensis]|uniref:uncharacterized protein LOC143531185 n=1 Tax=Bidens hawaiensis TaxID=980011 RepID=UPI004049DB8A
MGFNSVYKVLLDVFPQVDSRVLKAVAIEHSKDADMAVEVVLVEIIPNLPKKPSTVGSSSKSKSSLSFNEGGGGSETGQLESTMDRLVINSDQHEQSTETVVVSSIDGSLSGATEDTSFASQLNSQIVTDPVNVESLATSSYHDANDGSTADSLSTFTEPLNVEPLASQHYNINDGGSSSNNDQGYMNTGSETVENETLFVPETNLVATQEADTSSSKSVSEKNAFTVEFDDSDGESDTSHVLTRSEEKCNTEFLEEIIEEAKNNKKTLVSAMSSVIDLMREVENKEKAADQAKEYATQDCSDILAKAEEVKHALLRAKEANDMHAGEVNAEKAILATELKELQLRLFTLSDERNKSLTILDEMRRALEIRLATALQAIATAEEQKIENERAAREALLYQERQMEKVVEESKKLKLEAEENTKLQEFLMVRGRTIDILQGEISVKCQDVLLLKEKFDKGIPLSRSLSSSQTSSILASSGSSFRSVVTPFEPELDEGVKSSKEMGDSYGFVDDSSMPDVAPESLEETGNFAGDRKTLLEDGWDLFDH